MKLEDYQGKFQTTHLSRDGQGILTARFHSNGGVFEFSQLSHAEFPELFANIGSDPDNRAVIITGTGAHFIATEPERARPLVEGKAPASFWHRLMEEGVALVENLLNIPVPIIAAVNGPCDVHSEIAMLSDIVLCTPETYFTDKAHFSVGLVPGDSMQVVWPLLLGPNAGRYFLLTGQRLPAADAKAAGAVGEILPLADLMARAGELAAHVAARNPVMVRNTRAMLTRPLKRAILEELRSGLLMEAFSSLSGAEWAAGASK